MHISDLHRAVAEPLSNDEILSSLIADVTRYETEKPSIAKPDAIIVSGDLVQGLPLGSPAYSGGLVNQYKVTFDLLVKLADAFLAGDRSKLVMIPGNHDVDFNQSLAAMVEVKVRIEDVKALLFDSQSENPHRWSWSEGRLYKINCPIGYEDRFRYYCDTFREFYHGVSLAYPVDATSYSNLFELDNGNILVAAFNSCHGNDCFDHVGDIPRSEVAKCHLRITESGKSYRLKIAIWHHDIAGPPRRTDYMDSEVVKLLIDKGFRLGMHGHQHKANAAPEWVYTAKRTSMVVVSAGSLCAGRYDIPRGVSREYNVVEIDSGYAKARVHVREAKVSNIFAPGRFIDAGGASYEDIEWSPEETPHLMAPEAGQCPAEPLLARVGRIERMIAAGQTSEALVELEPLAARLGRHGRLLLSKALSEAKHWPRLQRHLAAPENADEVTLLVTAMVRQKQWQKARDVLKSPVAIDHLSGPAINDLEMMIRAEEAISR
jgi:hypothetical protein